MLGRRAQEADLSLSHSRPRRHRSWGRSVAADRRAIRQGSGEGRISSVRPTHWTARTAQPPENYRDATAQYHLHPEAKFVGGYRIDSGLTSRRHVAGAIVKEANEWERQLHLGIDAASEVVDGRSATERSRLRLGLAAFAGWVFVRLRGDEGGSI